MEYAIHTMTTIVFHYNVTETTVTDINPPPIQPFDIDLLLGVFWEYRMSRRLGTYGYPVLVILGTIGNVLSFVVMTRKSMIRSSTCFYMALLAVSETMLLYFGCLRRWYSYLTKLDAFVHSTAACRVLYFLTYWSMDFAAWILVAMTIERFVAIHFPFTVTKYATVDRAKKVSACIGAVLLGVNVHALFTLTIDDRGYCRAYDRYIHFADFVFPWIDAAVYSFVPFIVLIVFNVLIIVDWRKAARTRRDLRGVSRTSLGAVDSSWRLTAMLLSVSLAFLVATAPKAMLIIIRPYIFDFYDGPVSVNMHLLAKYTLTSEVMSFLTYTNHAITFALYCVNGRRFRAELRRLVDVCVHRKRRRTVTTLPPDNINNARTSVELRRIASSDNVDLNNLGVQSQTRGIT